MLQIGENQKSIYCLSPKLLNFEFGDNCQVKKTNLTRKLDSKRTKADSSSLRVLLFSKIEYIIQFLAKICYKFYMLFILSEADKQGSEAYNIS